MKQYKVALFSCLLGYLTVLLQMSIFFRHSTKRDAHTIMNEKQLQIPKNISAVYF